MDGAALSLSARPTELLEKRDPALRRRRLSGAQGPAELL
jgi:hypothetical protein